MGMNECNRKINNKLKAWRREVRKGEVETVQRGRGKQDEFPAPWTAHRTHKTLQGPYKVAF